VNLPNADKAANQKVDIKLKNENWSDVGCFLRALCDSFARSYARSYAKASAPEKGFGARGP